MNKASLLFAVTFLAAGCNAPKLAQTTVSSGTETQTTLLMNGNHDGPCIFDGTCTNEEITIFGRPFTITATDNKTLPGHETQETEKQ